MSQAGRQVLAALDDRVKLSAFRPDADDRQPEVQIRPNWERANALGLTTQTIGNTIQTAITYGIKINYWRGNVLDCSTNYLSFGRSIDLSFGSSS